MNDSVIMCNEVIKLYDDEKKFNEKKVICKPVNLLAHTTFSMILSI